jgi:hypothetical protein
VPYREKTAWLSLFAMALTFGPYFAIVKSGYVPQGPLPNFAQLGLYGAAAIVRLLVLGIGTLYLRHESPEEARTPLDERDRAINSRSVSSAYYVLMSGTILVGCILPFSASGWAVVNAALFWIVAAEIVRYSVVVYSYRRQA